MRWALVSIALLTACAPEATIEVIAPPFLVDSYPGNGSVIPADQASPLLFRFSKDIADAATANQHITLEVMGDGNEATHQQHELTGARDGEVSLSLRLELVPRQTVWGHDGGALLAGRQKDRRQQNKAEGRHGVFSSSTATQSESPFARVAEKRCVPFAFDRYSRRVPLSPIPSS